VETHWRNFGRNYYTRYDYENVDDGAAKRLMADLLKRIEEGTVAKDVEAAQQPAAVYRLEKADEYEYKDPVDGSISRHQGIRLLFVDSSRIVFRLSGTGSVGATIRIYIEKYEADQSKIDVDPQVALAPLVHVALTVSKIREYTGRDRPTVIT